MKSPDEIDAYNKARVAAIFEKFEPLTKDDSLSKSEDDKGKEEGKYYTTEDLNKFRDDLYKGIDDGTISEDALTKAQDDLLDLKKETRTIEGKEVEVFVKG